MFKNKKVFLPVLHVEERENTLKNVAIAIEAKADGIFLISHGHYTYTELIELSKEIKELYPELWIGYNFLGAPPITLFHLLGALDFYPDGIWIDDSMAGVEWKEKECDVLAQKWDIYKKKGFKGLYFGGVAFKYCKQPCSLVHAVNESENRMDVITTSGEGTGAPAEIEKISEMYSASSKIGIPLAIASGISSDNVNMYLPYVDMFLVSTWISISSDELDREKTIELGKMIHGYAK